MNEIKKCEVCGTTVSVSWYEWPVQDEITGKGILVCDEHAVENGFCPGCANFILGSENDMAFSRNGYCAECLAENDAEYFDDDDETDVWDYYPEYVDIIEGEEGGRYIGEGSEFAADDDEESGR